MLRVKVIVIALIIILSLSVPFGCQTSSEPSKSKKEESKKKEVEKATEEEREPVIVKDRKREIQLITFGPHEPKKNEKKPAAGNVYFHVTLNVTNSLTTYSNIATWDYWLIDQNGNEIEAIKKMAGWPDGNMIDLPPKEMKRVIYIFEIPAGSGGYRLTSDSYMIIDLK